MSHRLSPLTTRWMPPGASCAHPGTSEALSPLRAVLPVTLARMFGRAGVARAGRGPLAARSSTAAGWAGATATAGVWAAAFAAAAVLVARLVTAPRNASSRMAPAMAPTSTAATRRTGPTGRRRGGRGRPRRASAASPADRIASTNTSRRNSSHSAHARMARRLRIFRSSRGEARAVPNSPRPGMCSGSGQPTNHTSSHGTPPSSPNSTARASRPRSSRPAAATTRVTVGLLRSGGCGSGVGSCGSGAGSGDAVHGGGRGGGRHVEAAYPDQLQELGTGGAPHGDGHRCGGRCDGAVQPGGAQPAAGGGLGTRWVEFGDVAFAVGGQVELLGSGAGGGLRRVEGLYLGRQRHSGVEDQAGEGDQGDGQDDDERRDLSGVVAGPGTDPAQQATHPVHGDGPPRQRSTGLALVADTTRVPGTEIKARSDSGTAHETVTLTTPPGRSPPVSTVIVGCRQVTPLAARVSNAVRRASASAPDTEREMDAARAAPWAAASRSSCADTSRPQNTTKSSSPTSSGVRMASSTVDDPTSPCSARRRHRWPSHWRGDGGSLTGSASVRRVWPVTVVTFRWREGRGRISLLARRR